MKFSPIAIAIAILFATTSVFAAYEDYNKRYGEYRYNKLKEKGSVSKNVWVGSWWAYKSDGLANRYRAGYGDTKYQPLAEGVDRDKLSPAEKIDWFEGRLDKIDYDKIKAYLDKKDEVGGDVDSWIEERRELVYTLNRLIEENQGNAEFKWQDTEEGKKYIDLGEKIEEKQGELKDLDFDADTAYEWEIKEHGTYQFGVGSWWGHCNAWAAAAVMEPEPVKDAVINEIPFNVGDIKGLLTEAWMESNSSFFGSRNDRHKDESDREKIDYQDVTPAAYHIFYADQIGNMDKSFVIDAYTGDQVWNHPIKSYWYQCEPQYEIPEGGEAGAEKVNVKLTHYGGWYGGDPEVKDLGEKDVYPVLCTSSFHYVSDGVGHDVLTEPYDFDSMTYDKFKSYNSSHFHKRTLTYVLWLTAPMDDENARIIGDGEWNHGALSGYTDLHPDFMWQPTANGNDPSRTYENEFVDYNTLLNDILPQMIAGHEDPEVEGTEFASTDTPIDIPDAEPGGVMGVPAVSVINVDQDVTINELTVTVDITHTYVGDLQLIVGHDGKDDILKPFGEGGGDDNLQRTFDVKAFDGNSAKGEWKLTVIDQWEKDTGRINSWKIAVK